MSVTFLTSEDRYEIDKQLDSLDSELHADDVVKYPILGDATTKTMVLVSNGAAKMQTYTWGASCKYTDVSMYDTVTFTTYGSTQYAVLPAAVFFDSNNNYISIVPFTNTKNGTVTFANVEIPDNADYMIVNNYSSANFSAYFTQRVVNTLYATNSEMNKKVTRLPQFMNWPYPGVVGYAGYLNQMAVEGRYLYMTRGSHIYKIDVGCEVAPEVVLDVEYAHNITPTTTTGLIINGDYIYVGNRLNTASYPTATEISNKTAGAFVVLNKNDLSTVSCTKLGKKVSRLIKHGNLLIVNLQMLGWAIYDISEPSTPVLLSEVDFTTSVTNETQGGEVFEVGNRTYYAAAGFGDGIRMYDITDFVSYVDDPGSFGSVPQISSVAGEGNFLWYFIFSSFSALKGLHTYDLTVNYPYVYATIAESKSDTINADRVQGIVTLDVTNITTCPFTYNLSMIATEDKNDITTGSDSEPSIICRMGNTIIVNNDNKGIAIFDATHRPDKPEYEGVYLPHDGCCIYRMVATEDGRLFLADGSAGSNRLYLVRGLSNENI